MSAITLRQFNNIGVLNEAVAALLKYQFEQEYPFKHAVMLSGGNTPLEAYRLLAGRDCVVSGKLRIFLSDERLVPEDSPASNLGNITGLFAPLNLEEGQVVRVRSELEPERAAAQYDADLRKLFNGGGRIMLGLLGLGKDGHTASLFCREDIERGRGRYAVATVAPDGVRRVSVTAALLAKIQQVIFVVSGPDKIEIAEKLASRPLQVTAGAAVAGVKARQIWFAV